MKPLDNTIIFYKAAGEHGFLSNLYEQPLIVEGVVFPSAEHAYQYAKIKDPETREWVMQAPKPHLVSILAHGLFAWNIVSNWSKIKVQRMRAVLEAKFSDIDLFHKLVATGNRALVEGSRTDAFWGLGARGKGKNMLGVLLMEIREKCTRRP